MTRCYMSIVFALGSSKNVTCNGSFDSLENRQLMKICGRYECEYQGQPQLLENFGNSHSSPDGKASYCKNCNKIVSKNFRSNGSKKKPPRPLPDIEWRKVVKQANKFVQKAVRANKLPRISTLKCATCKSQAQHYHHWLGYDRSHWLDVVPLCIRCHRYLHRYF